VETERVTIGGGAWMRFGMLVVTLAVAAAIAGCGGSGQAETITITPNSGQGQVTVERTGSQLFSAAVAGISNTLITWDVCNPAPASIATGSSTAANIVMPTGCVAGGNTILGSITSLGSTGLYTAPATVPPNSMVSVVAVSQANTKLFAITNVTIDSGVRVTLTPTSVTVGTLEQFQFDATVVGDSNTAVSWSVNTIANNSTVGTITATACANAMPITPTSSNPLPAGTSFGCYFAPPIPQGSITVTATAVADTSQAASATVTVITATDPAFNTNIPLQPTMADEGSAQQDVYLFGTNFFSTSQVVVNGAPVPTTFVSSGMLRVTIPASFFSGPVPSGLPISVKRQNGDIIQPVSLTVQPMRPAVTALSPESFPTSTTPSATLDLNGGYFSSSTQASSGGASLPVTVLNSRQLQVTLSSSSFPFGTPGLVPILIQNSDVPAGSPSLSSVNVAISPSASDIPTSPQSTISVGTQPVAVGIDSALGEAVVVDKGSGAVSILNLDSGGTPVTVPVGNAPTSVGVDDILHLAAVVNSADNTLSIVNLQTQGVSTVGLPANPTGTTPAPAPFAVGVNSLTHRAIIAYSSSNIATVFDLSTNPPSLVCTMGGSDPTMPNNCAVNANSNTPPVSTGPTPSIAVEPQLNWAIVTPGGSGTVSIVDLGSDASANQAARVPNVLAFLNISTSLQGVAINDETEQALMVNPNALAMNAFSVLDQTVGSLSVPQGFVADAVNPLTDIGVAVNGPGGTASVIDLRSLKVITSGIQVGASPAAVAIDAGKNLAVVVNAGSDNVSILSLGAIRTPQITEVSPANTFSVPPSSTGSLTVTVNGFGFSPGAQVRLDGIAVPMQNVSPNGRQAIAMVPDSMLTSARRYSLDVLNSGGATSNVRRFFVVGAVPIGLNPIAVAVDPYINKALVTSQGATVSPSGTCLSPGSVSIVDLSTEAVTNTLTVGNCPEGLAVLPRLGLGVVANNGSADATVFDYLNDLVDSTVNLQPALNPAGVAIHPDTALTLVSNSNISSNSISAFTLSSNSATTPSSASAVDQGPFGLAVDPIDNVGLVSASTQNTADGLILLPGSFVFPAANRVSGFVNPLDVTFDPITDTFLVADSLNNQIGIIDAKTLVVNRFRVGIDPTAIAYNFQSDTGVTVNQGTKTLSIFDFLASNPPNSKLMINTAQTEMILPFGGSAEFSVAVNPTTNIAAVVDQANGRLLLIPLP